MANNIKVGIKFDSTKEVERKLQELLNSASNNTNFKMDIFNLDNFKTSMNEMSKILKNVENQCRNFGIVNVNNSGISSTVNEVTKLNNELNKINNANISVGNVNTGDLQARFNEIKSTVDKLASVKINTNQAGDISSAVISYTDSLGKSVSETMKWKSSVDLATGEIINSFQGVNVSVKDNLESQEKAIDSAVAKVTKYQQTIDNLYKNDIVPKDILQNLEKNVDNLSPTSSKTDYAKVEAEIRRVLEVEKEISNENKQQIRDRQELINAAIREKENQEKLAEKVESTRLSLQNKLNTSSNNSLIDSSVINNIQEKLNSINTNTPKREIKQLQEEIKNLSSSDSNIVRLQNSLNKLTLKYDGLKGKYGSLVGDKDSVKELKDYENQIKNLQNTLNNVKMGDIVDSKRITNEINQATNSFGKLENATKNSAEALKLSTRDAISFGDAIKNSLGNVGIYMSTVTVLREVGQAVKSAVGYVIELDSAMIDLKKVTDETNETYAKFKVSMHDKALELGTQSDKLIQAVAEWSRAGESFKDAQKLAENTLILSNVGDIDVQKSQEFLVAPLKAFNMEAEKSIDLIDKFNNISNNSANKVNDLGEGLNRAASSMAVAGNSLEQSMALIGTAQEKTQASGEVVGNSWKTISLRLATFKDEEGQIVPKLADDLASVGVKATEASGQLRSTFDIVMDVAKVYNSLDKNKQLSLLEGMAGKRHANILAATLSDASRLQEIYEMSQNSAGSAMQEFEKYQQSIQYSVDRLKEEMNGVYTTMVNDQGLKSIINGFATLTSNVGSFLDTFGIVPTTIGLATASLTLFSTKFKTIINNGNIPILTNMNKAFDNMRTSILGNTTALNGNSGANTNNAVATGANTTATQSYTLATGAATLGTYALQAALTMGLGLAIGAIISGLSTLVDSMITTKSELRELNMETAQYIDTNSKTITEAQKLSEKFDNLTASIANTQDISKRTELEKELLEVQRQLAQILPETAQGVDAEGNSIATNNSLVQASIELKREELKLKAMDMMSENNNFEGINEKIENAKRNLKYLEDMKESGRHVHKDAINNAREELQEANKDMQRLMVIYQQLKTMKFNDEQIKEIGLPVDQIKEFTRNIERDTDAIKANTDAKIENTNATNGMGGYSAPSYEDAKRSFTETIKVIDELQQHVQTLNDKHAVTPNLVQYMLETYADAYPEVMLHLNDAAYMQEFLNERIKDQAVVQQEAYQTMMGDNVEYYNTLLNNGNQMQQAFNQFASQFVDVNSESYTFDVQNFSTLNEAKTGFIGQLSTACAQWISSFTGQNAEAYAKDLRNCKTLHELKAKMISKINDEMGKISLPIGTLEKQLAAMGDIYESADAPSYDRSKYYKLQEQIARLKSLESAKVSIDTNFDQFMTSFEKFSPTFSSPSFNGSNFKPSSGGGSKPSSSKPSGGSGGKTDAERAEEEYQRERERLEKEANSNIEKMRTELVGLLKKKYEELRKAELDVTNKEIERLDKEIEKKQKELDRLRNNNMDEKEKIVAMEKELALWKQNSTEYGKEMVKQLEQQLTIAKKEQEIKELEELKKDQQNKQDEINKKYDEMTSDEKLYNEATSIMKNKDYEQMKNLIKDFGDTFKDSAVLFGKTIADIINDTVNELKGSVDFLGGLGKGYAEGGYTGDWNDSRGRIALLHGGERILSRAQTLDYHKSLENVAYFNKSMDYMRENMGNLKISSMLRNQFNALKPSKLEIINNADINITNNNTISTPWEEKKFNKNLTKQMTSELNKMGYKL